MLLYSFVAFINMLSFHLLKSCISRLSLVFLPPPSPRSIVCSLNVFPLRTPPSRNHVICLSADAGAVNKQHVFHVHISSGSPPPSPHPPPHLPFRRLLLIRPLPPPPPARPSSSSVFPGSIPGLILILLLILLLILRHDPRPHPPPPPSFLDLAFFPRLTVDSSHCAFSSIALLYII